MTTRRINGGDEFAAFLEMIPGAIIAVDSQGAIVAANATATALFGYERDALVHQRFEMVVPGAALELPRGGPDASDPRIAWSKSPETPFDARRKDGSEFSAEVRLTSTWLGRRVMVVAAVRDVTDRKPEKASFRGVVEGQDDAAVAIDRVGQIAAVNTKAEELFGYTSTELVDQSVELIVPSAETRRPVGSGERPENGAPTLQLGLGTPLEGRRKDGSEFPVEISLSAIDTNKGPLVSAAIRDATDRPESRREEVRADAQRERDLLESRLHQSHRLESLGHLAGGVAHDFNNILAAILNYVTFVSDEIAAELAIRPADARERLTAALTHQLLAFARREVRVLEVVDVNAVVREVESLLRRTIGEHVTLATCGASDLAAIRADRGQIEQILLNLAVNARDAMPNGGTLSVDTENFTVDDEYAALHPLVEAGPYVCLRVTDTGVGMDQETMDRAFEPFFSTKSKDKGTGLGLATVYGIVSQTGGLVELQSEVGVGTTVMILLPSVAAAITVPDPPRSVSMHRAGETVLVVEDEELVLDIATRILTHHRYCVLAARSGAEAMELIAGHPGVIDLLLTDVVMPGATGKEVAAEVSNIRPDIRVLYMSGYPESVIASQGVIAQGVRLLSKPFKGSDLLEHVRAVLDA